MMWSTIWSTVCFLISRPHFGQWGIPILVVKEGIEKRLADSIETVMELSDGLMTVDVIDGEPITFSQSFSCSYMLQSIRILT